MAPTRRIRWHLAWALALWLPLQALAYDQNRVATDDAGRADGWFYAVVVLAAHRVRAIGDVWLGDTMGEMPT